jgi:nitrate reductase molybdenum cofactor assembly chaperone NarJ/NarW
MKAHEGFYAAIAGLLAYPDGAFCRRLARCRELLGRGDPQAAAHMADFDAATRNSALADLEELYARTFDFNPQCALEIGWHLFGADSNRGALLVRLRDELARHGIQESCELPDHLTHVLPLLDRMSPDEAARFARACVVPAVEKMLTGLEGKQNLYENVFRCLVVMLNVEFGNESRAPGVSHSSEERQPGRPHHNSQEFPHEPTGIS